MVRQEMNDGWIDLGNVSEVKFYKNGSATLCYDNSDFVRLTEKEKIRLHHLISENMEGRLIGQEA